jgi:hypothetical protein
LHRASLNSSLADRLTSKDPHRFTSYTTDYTAVEHVKYAAYHLLVFVLPKWSSEKAGELPSMRQLWESSTFHNVTIADTILSHFDVNGDGTISYA